MHILFISILQIAVYTVGHFQSHFSDQIVFKEQIARSQQFMPLRASGPAVVQALGFKCIVCDAEFASRRGADCHSRHPTYMGTACADPSNIRSLSLTERPDLSVGILRQHIAVPLGESIYHRHTTSYQPIASYNAIKLRHKHIIPIITIMTISCNNRKPDNNQD